MNKLQEKKKTRKTRIKQEKLQKERTRKII